ncbi:MAG: ribonuclease P protein subunit [Candidatus Thermoplasmatota archaeon]|nr:ribonuclease P protein subunit [Candidatus Thermoplasmatota archaeon]MBU4072480.1 ribonuclease P protein subunit [Candidatus Thermoplasmatota archaeon]MBU4144178.1 ribonuclease P protein subunit [Candidatus Thermoplasmatota archaeon]MBU4592812.1 ribonuclease P protein subunit [Candidatus Thermoplasmatota archaeon]
MRTAENLGNHELIGLKVTVQKDERTEYEGLVIDETMKTFRLLSGTNYIMVPKDGRDFLFRLDDGTNVLLRGKDIKFRPEDRTKKVRT